MIVRVLILWTKVVIVVYFVGWFCDMDLIMEFVVLYGFKVIEDCA